MKIKSLFLISIISFSILTVIIASSAFVTIQQTAHLNKEEAIARDIQTAAGTLTYISNRYFLYQDNSSIDLWQSEVSALANQLSKMSPSDLGQQAMINNVEADLQHLNAVFASVVTFLETAPRNISVRVLPEFQTAWIRMAMQAQALSFDSQQLSLNIRDQTNMLTFSNVLLILAFLGAFGAYFITSYLIIYRKTIKSISELQSGIAVIGSGNLDFSLKADKKDEVGEISKSFNQMTANLKTVTASKTDLEKEIEERKKAERLLKASEETLHHERDLLQSVLNGGKNIHLVYLNRDFNFVRVNEEYAKTCGYTPEEMVGKNHFALFPDEENEEVFRRVRDTGVPVKFHDKPFVFPDQPKRGVTYWDWTLEPVKDETGKVEGLVLSLVETTERKKMEEALVQSEKKYRRLFETSQDGIMARDLDGQVIDCNQAYAKLVGYTKEELIRLSWEQLLPEKWHEQRKNVTKEILESGGSVVFEREYRRKDGLIFPASVRTWRLTDDKGKAMGTWSIIRDITEQKELQKKLEKHSEVLEKLVEERTRQLKDSERLAAIGATAGMVGHDIRNPLQAIASDVYLVKSDLVSMPNGEAKESMKESLVGIENNVEYVNKIVQDLQDYAKPLHPISRPTDLESLCKDAIRESNLPKSIKPSCKVDEDAKQVATDPELLRRVISNLVLNAVQAMPEGGKLSIRGYRQKGDVFVAIKDTGFGIPEEVKSRLFTPLFTTKSKGQGFGLAVVKRVTESMNGTITFESQEGKGTTFTIRLPTEKK